MSPHRAVVGLVVGGLSMGLGFSPSLTIPSRSGHVLHHSPARRFSMSVAESEPAAAEAAATGAAAAGAAVADAAEADAAEAQATGAAQPQGSAPPMLPVTNDWAGLPAAIRASRCGALTNQLVKAADAEAILKLTAEHVSEYNQINCATAMHHLAKRLKTERAQRERTLRDSRFEALLERTVAVAPTLNPRATTDVLWASATLRHWPPLMLKPLLTRVAQHLETRAFEPWHLALLVWALGELKCKPVRLLEAIEAQAAMQLEGLDIQNCANILLGFAKLQYEPATLLPAVATALSKDDTRLRGARPVEVADLAAALASFGERQPEELALLDALARCALPEHGMFSFSSRHLVRLISSFAALERAPPADALGDWVSYVRAAHGHKPLLKEDRRSLSEALQKLGQDQEDVAWLAL